MSSFAGMTELAFCRGKNSFAVECDCGALGPFKTTMEEAVDAWDTRTYDIMSDPRVQALVGSLRDLEKQATTVGNLGAVTGPQWSRLTMTVLLARAALSAIKEGRDG
ncbi:hypothetical protein DL1_08565 [Thioclava dalianensis]|uniref:Uncharacterized protein n=2 Tax=Thioclava dalianensis TaxID=1185766 RepID=A0A074TAK4_9RHOB|nr:hypothetical protein DL1_08565 [Thioclava dalianensis]SFN49753.1 hypothetical protein SAMN05216224_10674 [Thioclava dalianensis]